MNGIPALTIHTNIRIYATVDGRSASELTDKSVYVDGSNPVTLDHPGSNWNGQTFTVETWIKPFPNPVHVADSDGNTPTQTRKIMQWGDRYMDLTPHHP